jgi:6,7-dimethyl-8-ribityllumazine synthase
MSTSNKNLSAFDSDKLPGAEGMTIGIVVAEWNPEITEALYKGAEQTLLDAGCKKENIIRHNVPGSFELPTGALWMSGYLSVDAVICLGCVIQGETPHFEYICSAVSKGLVDLSVKTHRPFIFGVLTTNNMEQAKERAGGKHGNKGVEAAATAVKMVALHRRMKERNNPSIGFKS